MDEASTGVGGDELARQEGAGLGEEAAKLVHRVTRDGASKVGAFACPNLRTGRSRTARCIQSSIQSKEKGILKTLSDENLTVAKIVERVINVQPISQRLVDRNRPRR